MSDRSLVMRQIFTSSTHSAGLAQNGVKPHAVSSPTLRVDNRVSKSKILTAPSDFDGEASLKAIATSFLRNQGDLVTRQKLKGPVRVKAAVEDRIVPLLRFDYTGGHVYLYRTSRYFDGDTAGAIVREALAAFAETQSMVHLSDLIIYASGNPTDRAYSLARGEINRAGERRALHLNRLVFIFPGKETSHILLASTPLSKTPSPPNAKRYEADDYTTYQDLQMSFARRESFYRLMSALRRKQLGEVSPVGSSSFAVAFRHEAHDWAKGLRLYSVEEALALPDQKHYSVLIFAPDSDGDDRLKKLSGWGALDLGVEYVSWQTGRRMDGPIERSLLASEWGTLSHPQNGKPRLTYAVLQDRLGSQTSDPILDLWECRRAILPELEPRPTKIILVGDVKDGIISGLKLMTESSAQKLPDGYFRLTFERHGDSYAMSGVTGRLGQDLGFAYVEGRAGQKIEEPIVKRLLATMWGTPLNMKAPGLREGLTLQGLQNYFQQRGQDPIRALWEWRRFTNRGLSERPPVLVCIGKVHKGTLVNLRLLTPDELSSHPTPLKDRGYFQLTFNLEASTLTNTWYRLSGYRGFCSAELAGSFPKV